MLLVKTPLQVLISERMAEMGLSLREAERLSGGAVSHATFQRLTGGRVWNGVMSERVIEGVSKALNIPRAKLEEAEAASLKTERYDQATKVFHKLDDEHQAIAAAEMMALLRRIEAEQQTKAKSHTRRQRARGDRPINEA